MPVAVNASPIDLTQASDDVFEVAAILCNCAPNDVTVRTTPILIGLSNVGCFRHDAVSESGELITSFIEKRTRKKVEAVSAPPLQSRVFASGMQIGPRIHRIRKHDDYYSILMEFVRGTPVTRNSLLSGGAEEFTNQLTETLLIVSSYKGAMPETSYTIKKLLKSISQLADGDEISSDARSALLHILNTVPPILQRVSDRLPRVACHNDIFFSNFFRCDDRDGVQRLRLIDWGTCSRNIVGADLHHFVSAGLIQPTMHTLLNALAESYSFGLRAMGFAVSPTDIRAGAICYALSRSLLRVSRLGTSEVGLQAAKTVAIMNMIEELDISR